MTKESIIFGLSGIAIGGAIGFVTGRFFLKKKIQEQADDRVQDAVNLYNQYLEEAYEAMGYEEEEDNEINPVVVKEEEPEVEETKEEIAKRPGRIILKPLDDWEAIVPEDDWDREELWLFPDDDNALSDEDGNLLEPTEKYIGNNIEKLRHLSSEENESEKYYILNELLEKHYLVHRECDITRYEFFNY